MKVNTGIPDENRKPITVILNTLLADEFLLSLKTRDAHWNITGPHFYNFHKLFEAQYDELEEVIDEIAERIRSLGEHTTATYGEYLKLSRLIEEPSSRFDLQTGGLQILEAHEAILRALREDQETCDVRYQDVATGDFLVGLIEKHEKMAWMLRVSLEK